MEDRSYEIQREELVAQAARQATQAGLELAERDGRLVLTDGAIKLSGDFRHLAGRIRPGNLNRELIVRAAKVKRPDGRQPTAVDATAGLGEDSFLLAAAGFSVTLFERNQVMAALLLDAIRQAQAEPALAGAASRMTLVVGDSVSALRSLNRPVDVVLLDPMFPTRQKSAAVKKKPQLLQRLELPCSDEAALLNAALAAAPRKIVVKRPAKGPYLAGRKPDYSLAGKAVRFDCIQVAQST